MMDDSTHITVQALQGKFTTQQQEFLRDLKQEPAGAAEGQLTGAAAAAAAAEWKLACQATESYLPRHAAACLLHTCSIHASWSLPWQTTPHRDIWQNMALHGGLVANYSGKCGWQNSLPGSLPGALITLANSPWQK